MQTTATDYQKLVNDLAPKTNEWRTLSAAFLMGGAICALGEVFRLLALSAGLSEELAPTVASMGLILISAVLTSLGWYTKLAAIGGAGTLVPITGFANSVVSPAIEFAAEGWVLGLGGKIFSIAGPVLAYGWTASCVAGLWFWLMG